MGVAFDYGLFRTPAREFCPGRTTEVGEGGRDHDTVHATLEAVNSFLGRIKVFSLAESLGGVASLAEHPPTMSHASMPQDYRKKVGITDGLIRLSVGLENIDDLIGDLDQALELS